MCFIRKLLIRDMVVGRLREICVLILLDFRASLSRQLLRISPIHAQVGRFRMAWQCSLVSRVCSAYVSVLLISALHYSVFVLSLISVKLNSLVLRDPRIFRAFAIRAIVDMCPLSDMSIFS